MPDKQPVISAPPGITSLITASAPVKDALAMGVKVELSTAAPKTDTRPAAASALAGEVPQTPAEPAREQEVHRLRDELAQLRAQMERARVYLGLPDWSEASLEALLDAATRDVPDEGAIQALTSELNTASDSVARLEEELDERDGKVRDLHRALAEATAERDLNARRADWLERELDKLKPGLAHQWVDAPNPLGAPPESWDELIEYLPVLEKDGIFFTGNPRKIKEVASLDQNQQGLVAAWDALGTLADYHQARAAGAWTKSVHEFCETAPAGWFHVPVGKHAQDESKVTRSNSRLAKQRLFPVPEEVQASGQVHMWAHFKPHTWSAGQRLRIHYFDQVQQHDAIYIGYIGHHLDSGSTDKVKR